MCRIKQNKQGAPLGIALRLLQSEKRYGNARAQWQPSFLLPFLFRRQKLDSSIFMFRGCQKIELLLPQPDFRTRNMNWKGRGKGATVIERWFSFSKGNNSSLFLFQSNEYFFSLFSVLSLLLSLFFFFQYSVFPLERFSCLRSLTYSNN